MQAIIRGKLYDTDTATKVCTCAPGFVLYKTPNGRFFTATDGTGPSAVLPPGSAIKALDFAQARHYAEKELSAEALAQFFPIEVA